MARDDDMQPICESELAICVLDDAYIASAYDYCYYVLCDLKSNHNGPHMCCNHTSEHFRISCKDMSLVIGRHELIKLFDRIRYDVVD